MEKKVFKSILLLITYTIVLTIVVINFDIISKWFGSVFSFFKPFIWGFVIAFILNKPIKAINKFLYKIFNKNKKFLKFNSILSIFITYIIFIGLFVALISFILPQFSDSVKLLIENINYYSSNIEKMSVKLIEILNLENLSMVDFREIIQDNMQRISNIASNLLTVIVNMTAGIAIAFINIFISIIVSVYVVSSKDKLSHQMHLLMNAYIPDKLNVKIRKISKLTYDTFNNFVSGQLFESFILGCMCFIGMTIFRFEYAPLISVMIAVTSIIPVVGAFIGTIPSTFLLLMISPVKALWFIVFIIVIQQIEGNLIYPKVVGNRIGLPAIWVLFAIFVGGGIFGIVGVLLGVPVCSIIYTLLKDGAHKRMEAKNN